MRRWSAGRTSTRAASRWRSTSAAADEATEHEGDTVEASEEETEAEDPDLEPGEELEEEDFATDDDPMIDDDLAAGDAEGVLDED